MACAAGRRSSGAGHAVPADPDDDLLCCKLQLVQGPAKRPKPLIRGGFLFALLKLRQLSTLEPLTRSGFDFCLRRIPPLSDSLLHRGARKRSFGCAFWL